jgi:hypothetical protein
VNSRRAVGSVLVLESIWHFGGYILNEGAAERHVEKLRPAADRHERELHFPRGADQGNLGMIAGEVRFAAVRTSGLSVERRFYIFAACEKDAVDAGKNPGDCVIAGERRNDEWYEACTFKCFHVRAVESYAMRFSVGGIGRRRQSNHCRSSWSTELPSIRNGLR